MRRPLLPLAAATLAAVLTACGGDDGGSSAGGCTPPDAELTVHAKDELEFDAGAYESDAGCIEFTYVNDGSVAHTLLVKGKSGFKLSVGETDTGSIELPAGTYELFCDVAGHEAAGMKADLEVS